MRQLTIVILAAGSTACASAVPKSQFYQPDENLEYQYGNFCGAGYPAMLQTLDLNTQREERIVALTAIDPLDDIDRACKAHDLCYEILGHDNKECDFVLLNMLTDGRNSDTVAREVAQYDDRYSEWLEQPDNQDLSRQCRGLSAEILLAIISVKQWRSGNRFEGAMNTAILAMDLPFWRVMLLELGYPDEPGQCFLRYGPNEAGAFRGYEIDYANRFRMRCGRSTQSEADQCYDDYIQQARERFPRAAFFDRVGPRVAPPSR